MLPGMDGLTATRRIRAELPAARQPRIVAMTANVLGEQRRACLAAGMDDFVQKPVGLADLRSALARCAAREPAPPASAPLPAANPDPAALPEALPPFDPSYLAKLRKLGDLTGQSLVREVVDSFLADVPRRLERIREALEKADAKDLTFLAHSLKGSSHQIGAVRIATLSAQLEQKCAAAGPAELADLLAELESEIGRVRPLLEQAATGAP